MSIAPTPPSSQKAEKVKPPDVGDFESPLTGQQRAALWLAAGVFGLVLIVLSFDLWMLWRTVGYEPLSPKQLTPANLELYRVECEHYTAMTNAASDRAVKLFQMFIASSLLPLFTGIVGFIFGRDRS